jgi:hypothetical protein
MRIIESITFRSKSALHASLARLRFSKILPSHIQAPHFLSEREPITAEGIQMVQIEWESMKAHHLKIIQK